MVGMKKITERHAGFKWKSSLCYKWCPPVSNVNKSRFRLQFPYWNCQKTRLETGEAWTDAGREIRPVDLLPSSPYSTEKLLLEGFPKCEIICKPIEKRNKYLTSSFPAVKPLDEKPISLLAADQRTNTFLHLWCFLCKACPGSQALPSLVGSTCLQQKAHLS